jgi:hypothetical protein
VVVTVKFFFWTTALTTVFFLDEILSSPTQNLPAQNLPPTSCGPWVLWFGGRRGEGLLG